MHTRVDCPEKICYYNKKFISDPNSSITEPFWDFLSNFVKHYHLRAVCKYFIDLKMFLFARAEMKLNVRDQPLLSSYQLSLRQVSSGVKKQF